MCTILENRIWLSNLLDHWKHSSGIPVHCCKSIKYKSADREKIVGEKEDKSLILYFSTTRMRHYLEEEKRDRVLFLFKKRKSTLFRQFLYKACSTPKVLKRRQVYNILFCKTSESYGRFRENPTLSCGRIAVLNFRLPVYCFLYTCYAFTHLLVVYSHLPSTHQHDHTSRRIQCYIIHM